MLNELIDTELKQMVHEQFRQDNIPKRWVDFSNTILTTSRTKMNRSYTHNKHLRKSIIKQNKLANKSVDKSSRLLGESKIYFKVNLNQLRRRSCDCSHCGNQGQLQKRLQYLDSRTQQAINSQEKVLHYSRVVQRQQRIVREFKIEQIRQKKTQGQHQTQDSISSDLIQLEKQNVSVIRTSPSKRKSQLTRYTNRSQVILPSLTMHRRIISTLISDMYRNRQKQNFSQISLRKYK